MTIGFRIHPNAATRPSRELIERFRHVPVANVGDSMSRMFAGGPALRPMHGGGVMVGPALTVRCRPGDNLLLHKALDVAEAGDVVVVDAGGDLTNALTGEIMVAYAEHRRLGGFVINGAIRDLRSIRAGSFPVFAAGVTHRGPYKDGPGEINVPLALGGMIVNPGDVVVGDDDGLVCVPLGEAETILAAAQAKHAAEEEELAAIRAGRSDRSWVDVELGKRNVQTMR